MPDCALGIDTSCYTTSVALASEGKIINSKRRLLTVPEGERGLRQADGVFQHIRALPELISQLMQDKPEDMKISCVSVSAKPRDAEDSYMPVFATGKAVAESIAGAMGLPVYYTSHQQGHIRAAMYESGIKPGSFVALHLSGGTTQTLLCDDALSVTELGGSSDLNAGQLVDRVGVKLGLGFPCGPELEKLALSGNAKHILPVSRKDMTCSFSGAEAQMARLIDGGMDKNDAAAEVYSFLARSVARLIFEATEKTGSRQVLLAGGVASSGLLRELLPVRLKKLGCSARIYWGKPELSGDNACGVALIGDKEYYGRNN